MLHKLTITVCCVFGVYFSGAQTNPAILSWVRNTTGITGRHYISGNSTPIIDAYNANVQNVRYSANYVYVNSTGVPSYIVGPYLDGNPTLTSAQTWLFKLPLSPVANTGTLTNVGMGNIGVLKNGVPIYNYADGKSYNNANIWHQNAVYFEKLGFDCAKGHPSPGGKYHHHQNPTAFNLDKVVISTVCSPYLADGLYVMDSTNHSPLLGYAFDGFPIYGAYGYTNTNGTGGIKRMRSSYQFTAATSRTNGPSFAAYPKGAYMEDYVYVAGSGDLDSHNGRFAVTPEYPSGTYAYYTTVDSNQNSAYPYIIGPTYYGVVTPGNTTNTVTVEPGLTTYSGPYMSLSASVTNVSCNGGNNGSIILNITGGNSPFTYNWGGGITTRNRIGLTAGTYSVVVTDVFGQTATLSRTITQPIVLSVTSSTTYTGCSPIVANIGLTVNGGTTPYTYAWNNGSTATQLSNLASGTYSVIVTDAKGCTATSSATIVTPAPLSAAATILNPATCGGNGTIQITATGGIGSYTGTGTFSVAPGSYTYTVTDAQGCTVSTSVTVSQPVCQSVLNVKLFLQGYYLGAGSMAPVLMNQGISTIGSQTDSITVELHQSASPYAMLATTKTILNTSGNAACLFPYLSGNFYIVIKHRNGLETWSASPIAIGSTAANYDFTNASTKAYGANMLEISPGVWALYNGDINQDENMDLMDGSILESDVNLFLTGYLTSDLNGDGNVDLIDTPILENNVTTFVYAVHP